MARPTSSASTAAKTRRGSSAASSCCGLNLREFPTDTPAARYKLLSDLGRQAERFPEDSKEREFLEQAGKTAKQIKEYVKTGKLPGDRPELPQRPKRPKLPQRPTPDSLGIPLRTAASFGSPAVQRLAAALASSDGRYNELRFGIPDYGINPGGIGTAEDGFYNVPRARFGDEGIAAPRRRGTVTSA